MKFRNSFAHAGVCAFALTLAACGGGGVNSTPSPPPTGGGGGGTPTPTPPPSNANGDLTGTLLSEDFTNVAASASLSSNGTNTTVAEGSITASIIYDASNQSYTLRTPTGSIVFAPADIDNTQSNSAVVVYSIVNGDTTDSLTLTRPGTSGPITYQYVGSAFWQQTTIGSTSGSGSIDSIVYGVETPNADVPRTGSADYAIDLIGAVSIGENIAPLGGEGTVSVDFSSGDIIILGRLTIAPFLGPTSNFSGNAQLSSTTGQFSGSFTFDDFGTFDGEIAGRLFGPNAEEVGAAFSASYPGGNRVATGTIMGRRDDTPANTQFNPTDPQLDNSQSFTASEAVLRFDATGRSGEPGFLDLSSVAVTSSDIRLRFDASQSQLVLNADDFQDVFDPQFGFLNLGPRDQASLESQRLTYVNATGWKLRAPDDLSPEFRHSFFVYGFETADGDVPRTGSAAYTLQFSGSGADPDYNADFLINGTGVLRADFAAGTIDLTGGLGISENISLSGVPTFGTTAALNGTGSISSSVNSFSGSLTIDTIGNYSGSFDGSFFGPTAEEVGGTWSASDDNGSLVGTFIGEEDASLSNGDKLAGATEPVEAFARFISGGSFPNGGTVTYDPANDTYLVVIDPDSQSEKQVLLEPANVDAGASDDTFTVYTRPGEPDVTDRVFNPGAGNSTIALTYTSFVQIGLQTSPRGLEATDIGIFGIQTPGAALPAAGTGTYSGVVYGMGEVAPTGYQGEIGGTSSMIANWRDGSLEMTLSLTQADTANTFIGDYVFDGTIALNGFFAGARQSADFVGQIDGSFFGPNAEEFGATFDIIQDIAAGRTRIIGVTVGKRD